MIKIDQIQILKIIPPEYDARIHTDEEADRELLESIKELGVLLPLIVKKKEKLYEIIAGNRRYRASQKAGLPTIPCIVSSASEEKADKIKLHENIKRLPLGHIEQATTFLYLKSKYDLTENEIAKLIGKSVPYVSQHLTLLNSDNELVTAVHTGSLAYSVAREIMTLKDKSDRKSITTWALEGGASVDIVKNWVREAKNRIQTEPETTNHSTPELPPTRRALPVFECRTCQDAIPINEMIIFRVCPVCEHAIMSDIEQERLKLAQNSSQEAGTPPKNVLTAPDKW